jgi:hypothetical protein
LADLSRSFLGCVEPWLDSFYAQGKPAGATDSLFSGSDLILLVIVGYRFLPFRVAFAGVQPPRPAFAPVPFPDPFFLGVPFAMVCCWWRMDIRLICHSVAQCPLGDTAFCFFGAS